MSDPWTKKNKNLLLGIVVIALIGWTLIILIFKQQQLLKTQTQQRQRQIDQQAELIESTRQSGLVTLMSHLLDKIDSELQQSPKRILRDETITQIGALSYSFRSHEFLE